MNRVFKLTIAATFALALSATAPLLNSANQTYAADSAKSADSADSGLLEVNDDTFRAQVLKSKLPVVVDFNAPWCGPCKLMDPILRDLSKQYAGKVKFVHVDVDQSNRTALRYSVNALPTFLFFKNGKEKLLAIGLTKSETLTKSLEDALH